MIWLLIGIVVILGAGLVIAGVSYENKKNANAMCFSNEDCIKVQTTCCPCNQGGSEICTTKTKSQMYEEALSGCDKNSSCTQVNNCNISQCICSDRYCISR